ncbi:MAG: hypothetical protein OEY14_14955 [Myxococcales bacterium]|nr:hypothetical protein [Myxococcales bacterium]
MRLLLLGLSLGLLQLASGCDGCSCGGAPRSEGSHPYLRCAALEVPEGQRAVGGCEIRIEDAAAALDCEGESVIAIFQGPGSAPIGDALDPLAQAARAAFVLGSLGDDAEQMARTLGALGEAGLPIFVLAGGADEAEALDEALSELGGDAAEAVIDARALRRISIGAIDLIPLSGAPGGRYSRTDGCCGYGPQELEALEDSLQAGRPTYLLSWAAPAGWPISLGMGDVDAGDPLLGAWARERGIQGGVFAWPRGRAGDVLDGDSPALAGRASAALMALAPRLAGAPLRRADGSMWMPAILRLDVGPEGLALAP